MHVVIFEVEPRDARADDYFELAAALKPELEMIDGFLSVERFQSLNDAGRYVSLSYWRDAAAVRRWHAHADHRVAQDRGKAEIIARFRIRVAEVVRDYQFDAAADDAPSAA